MKSWIKYGNTQKELNLIKDSKNNFKNSNLEFNYKIRAHAAAYDLSEKMKVKLWEDL